jgi:tetratricopeptide (TPR) repeat protein
LARRLIGKGRAAVWFLLAPEPSQDDRFNDRLGARQELAQRRSSLHGRTMDRRTVFHLRLRLLWLSALALVGCGSPAPSRPARPESSAEPRRLQLADDAQSLRPLEPQRATRAAYPFAPKNSARPISPVVEQGTPFSPSSAAIAPNASTGTQLAPSQSNTTNGALSAAQTIPLHVPDGPLPALDYDGRLPPVNDDSPPALSGGVPRSTSGGMAAVNRRAEQLAMQGCSLAERGALFSARAQFIEALRLVAEAQDMEQATDSHAGALTAGLTALREVRDFQPKRSAAEHGIDLALVASAHRTPVLKQTGCEGLTAVAAQQRYLTYAQLQLEAAAGQQPAASFALYGMGRIAALAVRQQNSAALGDAGQAMALYQAAVAADARNFRAANELGVLLADNGRWDAARDMFAHSLSISPQPVAWQNLATAYERLGQPALAAKARAHVPRGFGTTPEMPLKWLDPAAFAQTPSGSDGQVAPRQTHVAGTPPPNPQAAPGTAAQPFGQAVPRR